VGIPVSLTASSEIIGKDGNGKNIGTREERTEELKNTKEKGKKEISDLSERGTARKKEMSDLNATGIVRKKEMSSLNATGISIRKIN